MIVYTGKLFTSLSYLGYTYTLNNNIKCMTCVKYTHAIIDIYIYNEKMDVSYFPQLT